MAEFYHTGQGFSDREWNDYLGFTQAAQQKSDCRECAAARARQRPVHAARDEQGLRVSAGSGPFRANRLELETIVVTSLRDGSSVVRPRSRGESGQLEGLLIYSQFMAGPAEFGNIQIQRSTDIGIRYHFSFEGKAAHDR